MRYVQFVGVLLILFGSLFGQALAQRAIKGGLEVTLTGSLALSNDYAYCAGGLINGRAYFGQTGRFSIGCGFIIRRFAGFDDRRDEVTYNGQTVEATYRTYAWSYGVAFLPEVMVGRLESRFKPFIGLLATITYFTQRKRYPGLTERDPSDGKNVEVSREITAGAAFSLGGYAGFDLYLGSRARNALTLKVGYEVLFGNPNIGLPTVFLGFKFRPN